MQGLDLCGSQYDPGTIAALLVYFAYALQCMATVGIMRRETGGWKWPAIAFTYLTGLDWIMIPTVAMHWSA